MIKKVKYLPISLTLILLSCNNFLTSPDEISSSKIAFIATDNSAAQVYTINSDGSNLKQISQSQTTRIESPRWLPHGNFISYWQSGELILTDVHGSTPETISDSYHLRPPTHWSPDGQYFTAYGMHSTQQEIYILSLQNASLRKLSQGSGDKFAGTWSPDGQFVSYITELGPNLSEVVISDNQGNIVKKKQVSLPVKSLVWSPDGEYLLLSDSFRLRILNLSSLTLSEVSGIEENRERIYQPVWSLHSEAIAFNYYDYNNDVTKLLAYDLQTHQMKELFSYATSDFIYLRLSPDWKSVVIEHVFVDKPLYVAELNSHINPRFRSDGAEYNIQKLSPLPATVREVSATWQPIQ